MRAGYTAPEALAGLAIVGLAIAGLTTSLSLIGEHQSRAQTKLAQSVRDREVGLRLERLLEAEQPYRSDQPSRLTGGPKQLRVACGQGECSARLETDRLVTVDVAGKERVTRLPDGADPAFWYVTSTGVSDAWPPPLAVGASWRVLEAIVVKARGETGRPLAVARIWR